MGSSHTSPANGGLSLRACVQRSVEQYLRDLDGCGTIDLYQRVLNQVEAPLLAAVMDEVDANQSEAARILGMSRNTLRKKLKQFDLLP